MVCKFVAAAIIAAFGSMPPRGTVVTVPKETAAPYSAAKQERARACALRWGIILERGE
jgi:hypothetical protein